MVQNYTINNYANTGGKVIKNLNAELKLLKKREMMTSVIK